MSSTNWNEWGRRGLGLSASLLVGLGLLSICLGSAAAAAPAAASIWHVNNALNDGLAGYWKFDQVSGTATINSVPLKFLTTLSNGASLVPGAGAPLSVPNFGALHLGGVNDVALVTDDPALDVSPTSFSVAVWARRATTGNYDAIYDSGTETNKWWIFIADNNTPEKGNHFGFGVRGLPEVYSTRAITDTGWHHLAVVKNGDLGGNLTFYVDGAASGVVTVTNVLTPTGSKRIGAEADSSTFSAFYGGDLDDLRLYNRALSAAEVGRLAVGQGCVSDGTTWDTAFTDLHCALALAQPGDEIWAAKSLTPYRPGTNRAADFPLKAGAGLFGGFQGNETSRAQRPPLNFELNTQTTLSGDLFADDPASLTQADNAFHVISITANLPGTVVDGVRVQAGVSDGGFPNDRGGGLYVTGGNLGVSNALFIQNTAALSGGGLYGLIDDLTLDNVTFQLNTATFGGGARSDGTTQINGGEFIGNVGTTDSGGLAISAGPLSMTGTRFIHNRAARFGGGVGSQTPATLNGVLFQDNLALTGGGFSGESDITVTGSQFLSNTARGNGGGLDAERALTATNVLFSGNVASATAGLGGGAQVLGGLHLDQAQFIGNQAAAGGGLLVAGNNSQASNVRFLANQAVLTDGGGLLVQGAALQVGNALFVGNQAAGRGGAIRLALSSLGASNLTAVQNSAAVSGTVLFETQSAGSITNSLFWHNGGNEFGRDGASSLGTNSGLGDAVNPGLQAGDPQFVREPNPGDGNWATLADNDYGDLHVRLTSPAIDAGDNLFVFLPLTRDLDGRPRFFDVPFVPDTGVGPPPIVDMGPYEAEPLQVFLPLISH